MKLLEHKKNKTLSKAKQDNIVNKELGIEEIIELVKSDEYAKHNRESNEIYENQFVQQANELNKNLVLET